MIYILPLQGKRLPQADKGSLQRKRVNIEFANEIDHLYRRFEDGEDEHEDGQTRDSAESKRDRHAIQECLKKMLISLLNRQKSVLLQSSDWARVDFFDQLG